MVAVLLQDDTAEQFLTPCTRWKDVKETEWTEESLKVLKLIFKGGPRQVLAVRVMRSDGALTLQGHYNRSCISTSIISVIRDILQRIWGRCGILLRMRTKREKR